jgi:hypothetical protein
VSNESDADLHLVRWTEKREKRVEKNGEKRKNGKTGLKNGSGKKNGSRKTKKNRKTGQPELRDFSVA